MKKCPYCAEEIQDEAIKCKHCKELLTTDGHIRRTNNYGTCSDCGKLLENESGFCSNCGVLQVHNCGKTISQLSMPNLRKAIIAGFFVLVFCALIGFAFRKSGPPPEMVASVPAVPVAPAIPDTKKIAKERAREFVEAKLKAPSTAKFQPIEEFASQGRPDKKHHYVWDVVGYVDSQNSYGAMLRQNFMCTMKQIDNGGWKLVELTFY